MTRIGFIGVGTMGLPMAKNLVKKGFAVNAFDTNPEAVEAAAAAGMTGAASAAETVATADLVITMLPVVARTSSRSTRATAACWRPRARERSAWTCRRSIPRCRGAWRRRPRERGVRFVDAPVSGGVPRAIDGTLAIMVGGAAEDVKEALPVLLSDGRQHHPRGAGGQRRGRQALQQPDRGRRRGGRERGVPASPRASASTRRSSPR